MMSPVDLDKAIAALRQRVREINRLIEKLERERALPAPRRKQDHKAASD
jgi:hypothetical protein